MVRRSPYVFRSTHTALRALTGRDEPDAASGAAHQSVFCEAPGEPVSQLMVPTIAHSTSWSWLHHRPGRGDWLAPPAVPRRPSLSTVLHLRRPVSFDADAVCFLNHLSADSGRFAATQPPGVFGRQVTGPQRSPAGHVAHRSWASQSGDSPRLLSRMRAWFCLPGRTDQPDSARRPHTASATVRCCLRRKPSSDTVLPGPHHAFAPRFHVPA